MTHQWDEFSKSLAKPLPRRESMRRLGAAFAGVVLGPFGAATAWARGPDPCRAFCMCRNKSQQNACLATCRACTGPTQSLCGSCGSYVCTDLASDFNNCGACGHVCPPPGLYESGACVNGSCVYQCVDGAVRCNGTCTSLNSDPNNCGACGNVCPDTAPYCNLGVCFDPGCAPGETYCDFGNGSGYCADLMWDNFNCGACFYQCSGNEWCAGGYCQSL
jgi:hypothetical protein